MRITCKGRRLSAKEINSRVTATFREKYSMPGLISTLTRTQIILSGDVSECVH